VYVPDGDEVDGGDSFGGPPVVVMVVSPGYGFGRVNNN
jgi:hypothetical protein